MVAPRTPNYRLNRALAVKTDSRDSQYLPPGTYVRPIEPCYVPEHVKDANPNFSPSSEVYIYTKYGIVVAPAYYLEEA